MASRSETAADMLLEPLPYQVAVRNYLKAEEAEIWHWFSSNRVQNEQAEAVRFELLKSTYRVDRADSPHLYETAAEVAAKLSLNVPVTIYQAQNPAGLNASLAYIPDEAHIVLHGPVSNKLSAEELRALLAHELAHQFLWQHWDGEFLIVDQILSALSHDERSEAAHLQTARLFGLYNEIFCDRAAVQVGADLLEVVSMLVKIETGVNEVNAASYLRQADEIFSKGPATTRGLTHPESFIRARALKLWSDKPDDATQQIQFMIEGARSMDELDLLGRQHIASRTRRLLEVLLAPAWFRTDLVQAHARSFFDDYDFPSDGAEIGSLAEELQDADSNIRDYYCYVLLDFATLDRSLEEAPLAAALKLSERLGVKDRFSEIAIRELRLRKRQFEKLDSEKESLLAAAEREL